MSLYRFATCPDEPPQRLLSSVLKKIMTSLEKGERMSEWSSNHSVTNAGSATVGWSVGETVGEIVGWVDMLKPC